MDEMPQLYVNLWIFWASAYVAITDLIREEG
jgi:hypothetical protein